MVGRIGKITLCLVLWWVAFLGNRTFADPIKADQLSVEIFKLVTAHSESIKSVKVGAADLRLDYANFYRDASFLHHTSAVRFLKHINNAAQHAQIPGFFQSMSFTSISNINGFKRSISYFFQSNGQQIKFQKVGNINGKLLRSSFIFNKKGRLLDVVDYHDNKIVKKGRYSI
jgi:hypothetical protein